MLCGFTPIFAEHVDSEQCLLNRSVDTNMPVSFTRVHYGCWTSYKWPLSPEKTDTHAAIAMGWKMLVSYIWRSKEDIGEKSGFYDFLQPQSDFYNDEFESKDYSALHFSPYKRSAKFGYARGSPAFRRKGLLKRQG